MFRCSKSVLSSDAIYFPFSNKLIKQRVRACAHDRREDSLQSAGLRVVVDIKYSLTLIKVTVAVLTFYVFKCLQDVHVSFMNPSVFVTQPSAKQKINFPSETETNRD